MAEGGTWTVRRILEWTSGFFSRKQVDSPRLSAELLLSHVLGVPRIRLYTDYERPLTESQLAQYRELVRRAAEHEPIAYLTGIAHFFNLQFRVTQDVVIPRPDTETLVENVLQFVRTASGFESPRVLDLCTGSGCIAAAIACHLKTAVITATEISPAAVAVAKDNFGRLGIDDRIIIAQGDLYEPLAAMVDNQPFHLIVSNPPYIATPQLEKLDRSVRDYEPLAALDGGPDGMDFHRRIFAGAAPRLLPGGRIYLEIAFDQAELAQQIAAEYPDFEHVGILKDFAGHPRVITARRR